MKKTQNKRTTDVRRDADYDEILPQYDFRHAKRNKYALRYASGSIVVVLEPDVAAAFRNSREANEALRALANIIRRQRDVSRKSGSLRDSGKIGKR